MGVFLFMALSASAAELWANAAELIVRTAVAPIALNARLKWGELLLSFMGISNGLLFSGQEATTAKPAQAWSPSATARWTSRVEVGSALPRRRERCDTGGLDLPAWETCTLQR